MLRLPSPTTYWAPMGSPVLASPATHASATIARPRSAHPSAGCIAAGPNWRSRRSWAACRGTVAAVLGVCLEAEWVHHVCISCHVTSQPLHSGCAVGSLSVIGGLTRPLPCVGLGGE